MPAIDPSTVHRAAAATPAAAEAQPYRDVARELDEMSLVLEVDKLRAEAARGVADDEATVIMSAPPQRVEANRRMTLAALRALPARASSLPPPPPRAVAPAPAPEAIRGMPIIAVGEPCPAPIPAAYVAPPLETLAPEPQLAIAFQPPMFADASRAPFPSVPPTSYCIPVDEPPPPSGRRQRGSRLRVAIACTVWAALLGGAALVATGHLGQRPEPQAMATPEAVGPAARPAPKPAAPPPAAEPQPEMPETPESEAATVEDLPDEPAKPAPVAAAPARPSQRNAASASQPKNHDIQIDSLFYGHTSDDRSVTLQVDGKEVIVREGDVTDDLVVENILPDGVVFKRGNRRFAVYKR
jgi:hypothetical protein